MNVKEIVKWLEREIEKRVDNYDAVYDTATIDAGIRDCISFGERCGFELLYKRITGKQYRQKKREGQTDEADNGRSD